MMSSRIEQALGRIDAAMTRLETARASKANGTPKPSPEKDAAGSAKIAALVNNHERLREEVAETMRDLDALIEELGG